MKYSHAHCSRYGRASGGATHQRPVQLNQGLVRHWCHPRPLLYPVRRFSGVVGLARVALEQALESEKAANQAYAKDHQIAVAA